VAPEADIVAEARRLIDEAERRGVPVRTIGGVAVSLHAADGVHPALRRPYRDIDLVTSRKGGRDTLRLLTELGYESNDRFNAMNGGKRLVVYDMENGRQLDVFVGEFEMCHRLPIADRLHLDSHTVPLAELLLTKLQVVRMNDKDVQDICAILVEHEVSEGDDDTVNATHVAKLLSADWGLWRTSKGTIETTKGQLSALALDDEEKRVIERRLDELWERIEAEPKSLRWKGRAKVGERAAWYQEPEEITHRSLDGQE
jgi:hypothetical protein